MKRQEINRVWLGGILLFLVIGSLLITLGINNTVQSNNTDTDFTIQAENPELLTGLIGRPSTVDTSGADYGDIGSGVEFPSLWRNWDDFSIYEFEPFQERGSRSNLLNPTGNFLITPIDVSGIPYSPSTYFNLKSDIAVQSFYEHSWRGEIKLDGTVDEYWDIVVPRPSKWEVTDLGISWCHLYATSNNIDLVLGGDWSLFVYDESLPSYNYYKGWREPTDPYIAVPFITDFFLRQYTFDIYASNDYYNWELAIEDGTSTLDDYSSDQGYSHTPIRNPNDDWDVNPLREDGDTGWSSYPEGSNPSTWLSNNPYPYSGWMSPTGEWQHDSWNDVEYYSIPDQYSDFKYYKIRIKDIELWNGESMRIAGLTVPNVYPEIGELLFKYNIPYEEGSMGEYYEATINNPRNNAWYQVNPNDNIPVEIGTSGLGTSIENDETIDNITMYVNNNQENKILAYDQSEQIPIEDPTVNFDFEGGWITTDKIFSDGTSNSYYTPNPKLYEWASGKNGESYESSYVNVGVTTNEKEWATLYDIGILMKDYGNTDQKNIVELDFDGSDTDLNVLYEPLDISPLYNPYYNDYSDPLYAPYPIQNIGDANRLVFDHVFSKSEIDPDEPYAYDYGSTALRYGISSKEGASLSHQKILVDEPNVPTDVWRVTPEYGLSLEFDYGYLRNIVDARYRDERYQGVTVMEDFTFTSDADNFFFISFDFRAHNGYEGGKNYTILQLISGDPNDVDNLLASGVDFYQDFLNYMNDEYSNLIYIENLTESAGEEKHFEISNFGSYCDNVVLSENLTMFDEVNSYEANYNWTKTHGYEIANISFYSVVNSFTYELINVSSTPDFDITWLPNVGDLKNYEIIYNSEKKVYEVYGIVEKVSAMNDSIYVDNLKMYHTANLDNAFVSVYSSSENGKIAYGPTPYTRYSMNFLNSPRKHIMSSEYLNSINHQNHISTYRTNDEVLVHVGSVMLEPQRTYNFKMGLSSIYTYDHELSSNNIQISTESLLKYYQRGSFVIKDIIFVPRFVEVGKNDFTFNGYNNIDPFYKSYYSEEAELGQATIIRNAFSEAVTQGYEKKLRLESVVSSSIYNENPSIGDYVEITLNLPTSNHYDIYLRDSLQYQETDHNKYSVSIDGEMYRRYVQDYDGKLGNDEFSYYQRQISNIEGHLDELVNSERTQQIHVASDYFTAGVHTLRITFEDFVEFSYYDPILREVVTDYDDYSSIRYNQVLLYYQSNSSYEIPVSYFKETNPTSNVHTITTEININPEYHELYGTDKFIYTTSFGLETRPMLNFKLGIIDDLFGEFFDNVKEGEIGQQIYFNELNGEYEMVAFAYDIGLVQSSLKYRINDGVWQSWDTIRTQFDVLTEMRTEVTISEDSVNIGENVIEIYGENQAGSSSSSYLAFYYDPNDPEITIVNADIEEYGRIGDEQSINFTISVTDDSSIKQISYSSGLQSSWDISSTLFGRNRYTIAKVPIFDKVLDRIETTSYTTNISIPTSEIEQGLGDIWFICEDMAGNEGIYKYGIDKVTNFLNVNFSEPNWRYVASEVPINFNATIYDLEGGDIKTLQSIGMENEWIKFGYGDARNIYNKIEHRFIARQQSLTKVSVVFQTPITDLKDFPAQINIKKGNTILSTSYAYPSTDSLFSGKSLRRIDIPDIILEIGEEYAIEMIPIGAPYNIMNVKIGKYSGSAAQINEQKLWNGESFGYYKGVRIPLNGYIIHELYSKEPVPLRQAGDVYYKHNNGFWQGPYSDGVIADILPIADQRQGFNNITIMVDNGAGYMESFEKQYRFVREDYHSPPIAKFLSPSLGMNYNGNMTIQLEYNYPEYNENYDIQLYIQGEEFDWTWFNNLTVEEWTEENTLITILDTDEKKDGYIWLQDSPQYQLMAYIDDGFDIYRSYSNVFTINNYGPNANIITPTYESRWNYNTIFRANVTLLGTSELRKAWLYYNDDPSYRFELVAKSVDDGELSDTYYFEYTLPLDHLKAGSNIVNFYTEDQFGRVGEDNVEIIHDLETTVEIEDLNPTIPNPYEETIVYFSEIEDYREVSIFLAYSESYGGTGFDRVAIMNPSNMSGEYSFGILDIGIYRIIIFVEDEAGNVDNAELEFNVNETGALKTMSENVVSIMSVLGGVLSLGIASKMAKNKTHPNNVPKLCQKGIVSNTKLCKRWK